ncbi:unnamed protein product, partial [Rhizoctonia solani]
MASGHKHLDTLQSKTSSHDLGYHGKLNYDPYTSRRESESERAYSAQPLKSSNDSLLDQQRAAPFEALNPTFNNYAPPPPRESYPAWGIDRQVPLSTEEIEDVFLDLTQKFGFQHDSMRNQ